MSREEFLIVTTTGRTTRLITFLPEANWFLSRLGPTGSSPKFFPSYKKLHNRVGSNFLKCSMIRQLLFCLYCKIMRFVPIERKLPRSQGKICFPDKLVSLRILIYDCLKMIYFRSEEFLSPWANWECTECCFTWGSAFWREQSRGIVRNEWVSVF